MPSRGIARRRAAQPINIEGWEPRWSLHLTYGRSCPICGTEMTRPGIVGRAAVNPRRSDETRGHLFPDRHPLRNEFQWILMCDGCNADQHRLTLLEWADKMDREGDARAPQAYKVIRLLMKCKVSSIIEEVRGRRI